MKISRSSFYFRSTRKAWFVYFPLILLLLALCAPSALAQEQVYFEVQQGVNTYEIIPLEGVGSVVTFYNYSNEEAHTGLEVAEHSILFLYRDTTTSELSLVVIHDQPGNGTGGTVEFSFSGLPLGATLAVRDDTALDTFTFTPPTAQAHWEWEAIHTDGLAISGLGEEFEITITPNFIDGIFNWDLVSRSIANPEYISLPSLTQPINIKATRVPPKPPGIPTACFTFSPREPSVGQEMTFDGSCSYDEPPGEVVSWEWEFGDGETATGRVVRHRYDDPGSYTVVLTVTDDEGNTDDTTTEPFPEQVLIEVSEVVVRATRTISTTHALPGSTFRVCVEIETSTDIEGLGLDENLPGGWEINPIDNAGAAFKRVETQWMFARTIRAGETIKITYDVTLPEELISGKLPVKECITGEIDSAQPAFRREVEGDSCLKVDRCLPIIVAIAHLDPETEAIDLTLPNNVTAAQLQRAIFYWTEDEPVPGTCGNLIDLETLKELIAHHLKCIQIDEPLPEEPSNRAVTISRTIHTPFPFHQLYLEAYRGNIFRVMITVEVHKDLHGLGLDENLPQRWEVRSLRSDGGIFKESQTQWVFPTKIPAGTTKIITYEVTVPTDLYCIGCECKPDVFNLSGIVDSKNPQFDIEVGGDTEIVIAKCLSIPVAIAYLDVETNTIDATLSSRITFEQIQAAMAFWLENEEVPGTCGKTIDFETMKLLIAHWLTDTPVDLPLGVVPEDP